MGLSADIRRRHFYQSVAVHDVVVGVVTLITDRGVLGTLLCTDMPDLRRHIDDLRIAVFCPAEELPQSVTGHSWPETLQLGQPFRGVVTHVDRDSQRILVSLKDHGKERSGEERNTRSHMGLITADDFPAYYNRAKIPKEDCAEQLDKVHSERQASRSHHTGSTFSLPPRTEPKSRRKKEREPCHTSPPSNSPPSPPPTHHSDLHELWETWQNNSSASHQSSFRRPGSRSSVEEEDGGGVDIADGWGPQSPRPHRVSTDQARSWKSSPQQQSSLCLSWSDASSVELHSPSGDFSVPDHLPTSASGSADRSRSGRRPALDRLGRSVALSKWGDPGSPRSSFNDHTWCGDPSGSFQLSGSGRCCEPAMPSVHGYQNSSSRPLTWNHPARSVVPSDMTDDWGSDSPAGSGPRSSFAHPLKETFPRLINLPEHSSFSPHAGDCESVSPPRWDGHPRSPCQSHARYLASDHPSGSAYGSRSQGCVQTGGTSRRCSAGRGPGERVGATSPWGEWSAYVGVNQALLDRVTLTGRLQQDLCGAKNDHRHQQSSLSRRDRRNTAHDTSPGREIDYIREEEQHHQQQRYMSPSDSSSRPAVRKESSQRRTSASTYTHDPYRHSRDKTHSDCHHSSHHRSQKERSTSASVAERSTSFSVSNTQPTGMSHLQDHREVPYREHRSYECSRERESTEKYETRTEHRQIGKCKEKRRERHRSHRSSGSHGRQEHQKDPVFCQQRDGISKEAEREGRQVDHSHRETETASTETVERGCRKRERSSRGLKRLGGEKERKRHRERERRTRSSRRDKRKKRISSSRNRQTAQSTSPSKVVEDPPETQLVLAQGTLAVASKWDSPTYHREHLQSDSESQPDVAAAPPSLKIVPDYSSDSQSDQVTTPTSPRLHTVDVLGLEGAEDDGGHTSQEWIEEEEELREMGHDVGLHSAHQQTGAQTAAQQSGQSAKVSSSGGPVSTHLTRPSSRTDICSDQQSGDVGSQASPEEVCEQSRSTSLREHIMHYMSIADLEKTLVRHLTSRFPKRDSEEVGKQALPVLSDGDHADGLGGGNIELGVKRKSSPGLESHFCKDGLQEKIRSCEAGEVQRDTKRPRCGHLDEDTAQLVRVNTDEILESEPTSIFTGPNHEGDQEQSLTLTHGQQRKVCHPIDDTECAEKNWTKEAAETLPELAHTMEVVCSDLSSDCGLSDHENGDDQLPDSLPTSWTLIPDHRAASCSKESTSNVSDSVSGKKQGKGKSFSAIYSRLTSKGQPKSYPRKRIQ